MENEEIAIWIVVLFLVSIDNIIKTWSLCVLKDARSVSLYPYNRSQILQYVKYTK